MIVTVKSPARKWCPYKDERDEGTAVLTFTITEGDAPELHNLSGLIADLDGLRMSHEDFTRYLHQAWAPQGCSRVVTTWHTAGLEVSVAIPH